jgi:hypothetical protein
MATTAQISAIQQLYVAYFNRPADAAGLDFWAKQVTNGASLAAISATFAATPEYKALFAGQSNDQIVATIYQNLFNRAPDASGLKFWSDKLTNKDLTVDNVVEAVAASAQQDPAKGADTIAIQSKVAAAVAFTDFLNTDVESRIAYSSGTVNSVGVNYIHGVTDAATLAAAQSSLPTSIQTALETGNQAVGTTYNLTASVDILTGTSSNDLFIASYDAINKTHTLGNLDSIDGGLGNDTLTVTDAVGGTADFSKVSIKNVETINVTTVTDLGATVNVKGYTGLTQFNVNTDTTTAATYTGATTTGLSVNNGAVADVTVVGFGGKVSVATEGAGNVVIGKDTGATSADANAITEAIVTGGTDVTVSDNSGKSGAAGTKLTTVTVDGAAGAIKLTGDALTTVNLANLEGAQTAAVINTKAHGLTLNVDTVEVGATATDVLVVTDTTATSATVNATGDDSAIALVVAKATKITVGGDAGVTLEATQADYTKLTSVSYTGSGSLTADLAGAAELVSVDSSTATGALDITIKGTNSAATPAAQSVTGGAGDDKVTITGTLGKGSTLSLGAGSDTVAVAPGGVILGDAVVDAGAGIDTLSLSVVDATNVGAFKNFELFDVANATGVFDQAILDTKNDVTGFVGTDALAGALTLQNLGAGVGFTILGDMGNANALTLTQATAGALTITSNVDQAKAVEAAQVSEAVIVASNATSLKLAFDNNNIDKLADYANTATISVTGTAATSVSIVSGGTEVNNFANITSAKNASNNDVLTSVTVTGDQHLTLDYLTGGGALKLASVDASGQTDGGLTFNLVDLTTGGTIKLGAGDDILTARTLDTTGLTAATALTVQTINGLEKASAEDLTTQDGFDVITVTGGVQAVDHDAASAGAYSIKDGVYTLGSGVTTLAGAVLQVSTNLVTDGATVVFNYTGSTYVYSKGVAADATDDVLVKVTGTTGITGLDDDGAGHIYLIG